ncbi:MAG: AAA family ATPase [Thermodesulfobacteriota bacterium]
MYNEYFGFKESPFSIAPDPRFLFMSERHQEALAHLLYGLKNVGGFVLVTGEVGTGKTTVSRCLLEKIPDDTDVAFIIHPRQNPVELLASICDEFGIRYPAETVKVLVDRINEFLLANHGRGRHSLLVIDEAQTLDDAVLEQIRLLTNLETDRQKLLQIIMLGQPELQERLARPELRQLSQRITARYHLTPLDGEEIAAYVHHRLLVAGCRDELFSRRALRSLRRLSGGIPRLVNLLCDRALLGAYATNSRKVTGSMLAKAHREVCGRSRGTAVRTAARPRFWAALLAVGLVFIWTGRTAVPPEQPLPVEGGQSAVFDPAAGSAPAGELARPASEPVAAPPLMALSADSAGASLPADGGAVNWDGIPAAAGERKAAFATLYSLWGLSYDPALWPCEFGKRQGLACHFLVTGLDGLLRINRPAALQLFTPAGREMWCTLVGRQGNLLEIGVGDRRYLVDPEAIILVWSGRATVLWRPPAGYDESLGEGAEGAVVDWIQGQLACTGPLPGADYDAVMVQAVKRLQFASGFVPDGKAGPLSMMLLQQRQGYDGPTLVPVAAPCEPVVASPESAAVQ